MDKFTPWVFLWETNDGQRQWDVLSDGQLEGFLQKIVEEKKVNLATVMASKMPIGFSYAWNKFHGGLSSVNFGKLNSTIYGTEPPKEIPHQPVVVQEKPPEPESHLGWLAPDGRFFPCEYGGHTQMAIRIVGDLEPILDSEKYLEDHGWAKIFRDPLEPGETFGMGYKKVMTDAQMKYLTRMHLDTIPGVKRFLEPSEP